MAGVGTGFRKFLKRGNIIDLAVAFVIGVAFATLIKSFVGDILMPPLGRLLGNVDFTNMFAVIGNPAGAPVPATLAQARAAGLVTINYGLFINAIIEFLVIALALYGLLRALSRLGLAGAADRECPLCATVIPQAARRCPHCTADLTVTGPKLVIPGERERPAA